MRSAKSQRNLRKLAVFSSLVQVDYCLKDFLTI